MQSAVAAFAAADTALCAAAAATAALDLVPSLAFFDDNIEIRKVQGRSGSGKKSNCRTVYVVDGTEK